MGYEVYEQTNLSKFRFAGHGVISYCDYPGCSKEIDRGMSYACCGAIHFTGSCGGFYCSAHQEHIIGQDEFEDLEPEEIKELLDKYGLDAIPEFDVGGVARICNHPPIEFKEHPRWIKHISTDRSWAKFRKEQRENFRDLKSLNKVYGYLDELKKFIDEALEIGQKAADVVEDGGTANLDAIVLYELKHIHQITLQNLGISCFKNQNFTGSFMLTRCYGQGDKNTVGLKAALEHLKKNNVRCYMHTQRD